ncbi:MAG: hypothetical protein ABI747_01120 [Candidatus Moraniibacteriota bacterium]
MFEECVSNVVAYLLIVLVAVGSFIMILHSAEKNLPGIVEAQTVVPQELR